MVAPSDLRVYAAATMRFCPDCKERTESLACPVDRTPTLDEEAFGDGRDPLIGRVFDGRYEVVERIGKGGMGSVYRARQLTMGREIALKVLNPELARDQEAAGRFVREAKVASRLRHTNTIVVFDFGHSPQGLYLAMELLDGENMAARLAKGPMAPVEAARICAAVARSLSEAHSVGIVHRDLKPDNIFLHRVYGGQEVVKVLDFGVAKFIHDERSRSGSSVFETNRPVIAGTLGYLAPEQARGEPISVKSDLYALGVVLYRALTGRLPFNSDTPVAVLRMHIEDPPPPLPAGTPEALRSLVMRLMEKRPDARPESAEAVATELERYVASPEAATVGAAPVAGAVDASAHTALEVRTDWIEGVESSRSALQVEAVATKVEAGPLGPPTLPPQGATELMPWETGIRPPLHPPEPSGRSKRSAHEKGRSPFGAFLAFSIFLAMLAAVVWFGWKWLFAPECTPGALKACTTDCEGGSAKSCQTLAVMLSTGQGTKSDPARAATLFDKACQGGEASACGEAARAYAEGDGVGKDFERAAGLFRRGCDGGDGVACARLAEMYDKGRGVARSKSDARKLYAQACKAGQRDACDQVR